MKSYRENPDGEENQTATRQNEREIFALKQMAQAGHTPGPWNAVEVFVNNAPNQWHVFRGKLIDQWGKQSIAVCDSEEHAKFIVRACNAHAELLRACERCRDFMQGLESSDFWNPEDKPMSIEEILKVARAAIAKAEGEK